MDYLHSREIVHRDLKPENILINDINDLSTVKLTDFGLSAQYNVHNEEYDFCGTLLYMAPEQMEKKIYSKSIDIWSVGIMMYMLLHKGRHPLTLNKEENLNRKSILERIKTHKFQFSNVSYSARHLNQRMNCCTALRYYSHEALRHPFITRNCLSKIPQTYMEQKKKQGIVEKMKKLITMSIVLSQFSKYIKHSDTNFSHKVISNSNSSKYINFNSKIDKKIIYRKKLSTKESSLNTHSYSVAITGENRKNESKLSNFVKNFEAYLKSTESNPKGRKQDDAYFEFVEEISKKKKKYDDFIEGNILNIIKTEDLDNLDFKTNITQDSILNKTNDYPKIEVSRDHYASQDISNTEDQENKELIYSPAFNQNCLLSPYLTKNRKLSTKSMKNTVLSKKISILTQKVQNDNSQVYGNKSLMQSVKSNKLIIPLNWNNTHSKIPNQLTLSRSKNHLSSNENINEPNKNSTLRHSKNNEIRNLLNLNNNNPINLEYLKSLYANNKATIHSGFNSSKIVTNYNDNDNLTSRKFSNNIITTTGNKLSSTKQLRFNFEGKKLKIVKGSNISSLNSKVSSESQINLIYNASNVDIIKNTDKLLKKSIYIQHNKNKDLSKDLTTNIKREISKLFSITIFF